MVTSAESHTGSFASCGAVKQGIDPDKTVTRHELNLSVRRQKRIRDVTAILQTMGGAKVETHELCMALNREL